MLSDVRTKISNFFDRYRSNTSVTKRFTSGAFWSLGSTAAAQGLGLLASVVTARIIGKIGFGELGVVNSTIGTFGTFAGLGLGYTSTKYLAELRYSNPIRAGRILGLVNIIAILTSFLVATLLFVSAPVVSLKMLNAPYLVGEIRIGVMLVIFNTLMGVQIGILSGFEAFKTIAKLNVIKGLLNFPLVLAGAFTFGLYGVVVAMVIVSAVGFFINQLALRHQCSKSGIVIDYANSWSEFEIIWKFSLPALMCNIFAAPVLWLANTILVQQPRGYEEVALVNAANQWRTVLMLLPSVLCSAALPILAAENVSDGKESGYGRIMEITQDLSILIVIPMCAVIMFLGDFVMSIYGKGFSAGVPVLIGVVLGIGVSAIGSAAGAGIAAKGRLWLGFVQNLSWGVVFISLVWLFAPGLGAASYGLGFAVSHIILIVWGYYVLRNSLPLNMLKRTYLSVLYMILLATASLWLPSRLRHIAAFPVLIVTIFVVYFLMSKSRQHFFSNLIRRRSLLNQV